MNRSSAMNSQARTSSAAHTSICREGFYYLLVLGLVFGGAMIRDINLLLVVAGLLLGPLAFNWRAVVVTLRGLRVERKAPQSICAGDLLVTRLSLTNSRRRLGGWAIVVEDRIQLEGANNRDKPIKPGVLFVRVPAGQTCQADYRGRLVQRGRYRLGPLRVSTRFPFGLICRSVVVEDYATITVLPRPGRLTQAWHRRQQEAFAGAQRRERRHGMEGDFYGLRQWREGDSLRWVHWRSSARRGSLLVRQFEQPRNREVLVLLDLWQPERPTAAHLDNVELAVSFAATVLADLCRKGGAALRLVLCAPHPLVLSGAASSLLLGEMLLALAGATAYSRQRLPELLRQAMPHLGRGCQVILVSTQPVDLENHPGLDELRADPGWPLLLRRIRCVDTSSHQFSQLFEAT